MQTKLLPWTLSLLCVTLLAACTPKTVTVEKPVAIQRSLAPLSAEQAQVRDTNFNTRMQQFIRNKDGQIRFSPRDAEWLTLFAGEADSVVIQVGGLQSQAAIDREYINQGTVGSEPTKK